MVSSTSCSMSCKGIDDGEEMSQRLNKDDAKAELVGFAQKCKNRGLPLKLIAKPFTILPDYIQGLNLYKAGKPLPRKNFEQQPNTNLSQEYTMLTILQPLIRKGIASNPTKKEKLLQLLFKVDRNIRKCQTIFAAHETNEITF